MSLDKNECVESPAEVTNFFSNADSRRKEMEEVLAQPNDCGPGDCQVNCNTACACSSSWNILGSVASSQAPDGDPSIGYSLAPAGGG